MRVSGPWRQNVFKNCNFIRKTTQPKLQSDLNRVMENICSVELTHMIGLTSQCPGVETDINSQQAGARAQSGDSRHSVHTMLLLTLVLHVVLSGNSPGSTW